MSRDFCPGVTRGFCDVTRCHTRGHAHVTHAVTRDMWRDGWSARRVARHATALAYIYASAYAVGIPRRTTGADRKDSAMSPTPRFNPFTNAPGSYEDLLERYGHVVITTRVNLKNKRRVCFTLEDVEQERRASVYLRKNVRNEPWGVTCDSGSLISPPLPPRDRIGTGNTAERYCVIRFVAVEYGHNFQPMPDRWYGDWMDREAMLAQRDWHQSLTNVGVRISYLSRGERRIGYNRDYGLYVLACENGEWVWPNAAQLRESYRAIMCGYITDDPVLFFDRPAMRFHATKEKALDRLFPDCYVA